MIGHKAASNHAKMETWIYTVNTEATAAGGRTSAIPFTLDEYPTDRQQLIVDWGDGNIETLTPEDYTKTDPSASIHEYNEPGTYQIRVSSTVFSTITIDAYSYGENEGGVNSSTPFNPICIHLKHFHETLVSIQNPLPRLFGECIFKALDAEKQKGIDNSGGIVGIWGSSKYFSDVYKCATFLFYNCDKLVSIPNNLLTNYLNAMLTDSIGVETNVSCYETFKGCASLQSIPDGVFQTDLNILSFSGCFQDCTSLQSIPDGLFNSGNKAREFTYCFQNCSSLQSIPARLFAKNTAATTFYYCFSGCTSLQSIPSRLFENNTAATSFSYCFNKCSSLQSIPSGLFDRNTLVTNFSNCFDGCSSLQSIPSGMFDKNTAATNFQYCFRYCSSLQSIPSGMFDKNTAATSFANCFYNCSSIQSIPSGMFDKNTAVITFSGCFYGCTSLQSIPSGLFDKNTAATSFDYCFSNCTSLQSIPSGLFDKNTAATRFDNCFYNCTSLQSIPAGLFDKNTLVTNFSWCFQNCTSLQSIPSGLFNKNTAATSFSSCFSGCSSLQSIPSGIFDGCTAATNFGYCFNNCASIQSIPVQLFFKNTSATSFSSCLAGCSSLKSFKLIIGSSLVSSFTDFISTASNVTRIVCVPEGSTTYTKLAAYAQTGNDKNNITVSTTNMDCVQTFEYTVDTDATTANAKTATIPLQATQNASSNLMIDWGDGNGVELLPSDVTTANLTHTYSSAGNYQITVGSINWLDYQFLADSNANSSDALIQTFRDTVISIDEAMPLVSNANLDYWFYNCKKLVSYSSRIFDNLPNAASAVSTFNGCTSLAAISAGTLRRQENLVDATSMFEGCSSAECIPSGLVSQCRKLSNATQMFKNCTSLTYYPNTLLLNNALLTTRTDMFAGCSNANPTFNTKEQLEANGYFIELYDTEATDENGNKAAIPFNLTSQTVTLAVNWGDSTTSNLTASDYTEDNSTSSIHQYSNSGIYFVSIQSTNWSNTYISSVDTLSTPSTTPSNALSAICLRQKTLLEAPVIIPMLKGRKRYNSYTATSSSNDSNNTLSYSYFYSYCTKLKNVCIGLFDSITQATSFNYCFYKCSSLQSIPSGLFSGNTQATTFNACFNGCSSLQSIPSGLFSGNTRATGFNGCFSDCSSVQSIPEGLFDNSNVTNIQSCFFGCSSIQSIPSGLFQNKTLITNFWQCFSNCSSLQSIPEGLFDSCTAATNFDYCFDGCSSLQSIPEGLFDKNTAATSFNSCFYGCSSIRSIPEGLFDKNTAVTNFSGCFYRCSSLQFIPEGLFDNNTAATTFGTCFNDCSSLQSIPSGLFDNNTVVTNFASCFYQCKTIRSIPEGLFDNNTRVTTFYCCFDGCTSLQSIPEGLFDKNTAVTNFQYCFYGCSSLQSIPAGLFDKNTAATSFNSCFQNCTSLQSIPSGIFDNNTAVTSFYNCFYSCSSLRSIPAGIFNNNTAAINFQYCFYNCGSLASFTIYITSDVVSNCSSFVTKKTGTTRIVYVPAESTTYTKFKAVETTLGLTVNPITYVDITFESSSDEKTYDGTALTGGTVTLSSGSLTSGDSFTYQMTGRQELIGSSDNTFTYSISNVSETHYRVTQVYGTLTVTDGTDAGEEPVDDALIVEMTAEGQEGSEDERQYALGEEVTFEISVKNPYDQSRTITLTEIEYVTLTQSTFVNVASGQTISTTATYTVTEEDIFNGSFTNTVSASIGNLEKTAECTILTESSEPHISILVEETSSPANGETYTLDETIEYDITVTNDGNSPFSDNISVNDEASTQEWTIDFRSFTPSTSRTYSASYTVTEMNIVEGCCIDTVTVETSDYNGDEYTTSEEFIVENIDALNASVDISINNMSSPSNGTSYVEGEVVTYAINATNNGNVSLSSLNISNFVTIASAAPGYSITSSLEYLIKASDIANGYFTITHDVTADSPDLDNPTYSESFDFEYPIIPQ